MKIAASSRLPNPALKLTCAALTQAQPALVQDAHWMRTRGAEPHPLDAAPRLFTSQPLSEAVRPGIQAGRKEHAYRGADSRSAIHCAAAGNNVQHLRGVACKSHHVG